MWTEKMYLIYAKRKRKEFKQKYPNSSKPRKLFRKIGKKEYIFSNDNWNDSDLVRDFIVHNMEEKGNRKIVEEKNGISFYIFFSIENDVRYASIIVYDEENSHDNYQFIWYKHRGQTDSILKNGRPIFLEEYVKLMNLLEIKESV